jgi:phosphate-induced protein 1
MDPNTREIVRMKLRFAVALAGGAMLAVACSESSTVTQPATPSFLDVSGAPQQIHVMPTRAVAAGLDNRAGGGKGGGTGIVYHGGPILQSTKVVAIYWSQSAIYLGGPASGTGTGSQDGSLVGFFLRSLGGSPYFNINSTYFDGNGVHVNNSIAYTGYWATGTNPGSSPSDAAIRAEIASGFTSNTLTYDPSTIYLVFTGTGVNLGGGFGSQYCAYHGHFSWNGNDVKYAAQPYNADFVSGCTALSGSPNNDFAADAEVNTLAHETEEAATDPDLNAWYDRRGQENADKCAWTFGSTYKTGNGSVANMSVGGKDFLIQRNWVNAGSGGCLTSYP